jgi:threonine aldolase
VATGTAANALALATVTPPYGVVYSPAGSHAASDECNAPEAAMSGAKFIAVPVEHRAANSGGAPGPLGLAIYIGFLPTSY